MDSAFVRKNKFAFLGFVLSLIAISSCSNVYEFAVYNIEGTVKEASGLTPLKNIRLIRPSTDYLLFPDTIYTDSLGRYSFNFTDYYKKNYSVDIKAEDIDGNSNKGSYSQQTVRLTFTTSDWSFTQNNKQLEGMANKILDFKLNISN